MMKSSLIIFAIVATSALDVMRIPLERIENIPQDRDKVKKGKEKLTNYLNTAYTGDIEIGTPAQKLKVNFDTGSDDFWVVSSYCKRPECDEKTKYDNTKSTTVNGPLFQYFKTTYLMGSVEGLYTRDKVCVAEICIENQIIGEAGKFTGFNIARAPYSGIIGLGYNAFTPTVFDNMVEQGLVKENKFGVWLNRDPKKSKGGMLFLGGGDSSYYKGKLSYFDVTSNDEWGITADKIKLGDLEVVVCGRCQKKCTVVVDTGNSFIEAPSDIAKAMNEKLGAEVDPDSEEYMVDCHRVNRMPDLTFTFNGKDFVLHPKDYIVKVKTVRTKCYSGISPLPEDDNYIIAGQAFIGKFYTEFDQENGKIGFARAN